MAIKIGYLDSAGHPYIKVKVFGFSVDFQQEFEAMIDTGFTGFLMLPITSAFPLALTLLGTTSYTLADGTTSPKLLAFGTVTVEDESVTGTIVLESNSNSGPLLGMDFLRKLDKALLVGKRGVALLDEVIPPPAASATLPTVTASDSSTLPLEQSTNIHPETDGTSEGNG